MKRTLAAFVFMVLLAGCANAPPLAKDLPGQNLDTEFNERVKARFPPGSRESDLIAELKRQGFRIEAAAHQTGSTSFANRRGAAGLIVTVDWIISWKAEHGVITAIQGNRYGTSF